MPQARRSAADRAKIAPPAEVVESRALIKEFWEQEDAQGRKVGRATCGVYAFYDYDGEPIYVGKTWEGVRVRVGRHLTGRRSDAVGKFVLDPFEVLDLVVYPLYWLPSKVKANDQQKRDTTAAEYQVYQQALAVSHFGAVLNEGVILDPGRVVNLPEPFRGRIVPARVLPDRQHPDVRLARRAMTVANLARLVSERDVKKGLRTTLHTQTQRLNRLAAERLADFAGEPDEVQQDD